MVTSPSCVSLETLVIHVVQDSTRPHLFNVFRYWDASFQRLFRAGTFNLFYSWNIDATPAAICGSIPSLVLRSANFSMMASQIKLPPELWAMVLQCMRGRKSQDELIDLWTCIRCVSRLFREEVEGIFATEHLPVVVIDISGRKPALWSRCTLN